MDRCLTCCLVYLVSEAPDDLNDFLGSATGPTAQIGLGSSKDLCAGVQFRRVARHFAHNLLVCALRHAGLPQCDFPEEDALF